MSEIPRDLIHRQFTHIELDLGRRQSENPRLVQSLLIYRAYDATFRDFRPLVLSYVQLFDPFCEISFHSQQNTIINHSPAVNFVHLPVNCEPTLLQNRKIGTGAELTLN
jgi:hypothetical protein